MDTRPLTPGISETFVLTALLRARYLDHLFDDMRTRDHMLAELDELGVNCMPLNLVGCGSKYILSNGRLRLRTP